MGTASTPHKVQLFFAFLFSDKTPVEQVLGALDREYGERDRTFGPIAFSWTEYYRDEMGAALQKMYFNYREYIHRDQLPAIKIYTNSLEEQFTNSQGNRLVNIDPGYVARDKVVLATTKDFFHRLYLANGIFGEVTLHYRKGRFRYFSWTYPDFRDPQVMQYLEQLRAPLVRTIRRSAR